MQISSFVIDYLKQQSTPTVEGMKRYAPTGEFCGLPCVCDSRCAVDCGGECGCECCAEAIA